MTETSGPLQSHRARDTRTANASAFCVQYSLARMVIEEWGVQPCAVMGYSVGEMAAGAAHAAIPHQEANCVKPSDTPNFSRLTRNRGYYSGCVAGIITPADVCRQFGVADYSGSALPADIAPTCTLSLLSTSAHRLAVAGRLPLPDC